MEIKWEDVIKNKYEVYLSHFSYTDWNVGEDNVLRVGDYVRCDYHFYDYADDHMEGKIVKHPVNDLPVILLNTEYRDTAGLGDYADIQGMFMQGWEFSRIMGGGKNGD